MSGPPPRPGPKAGDFLYEMTPYLVHIMFVPQVCIICLTLLDRHRDDIKWFLLNTAVINIATGVSMEIKRFPGSFLNIVNIIGMDLSRYSIFFSALTRILILHWPNSYKKATNGKRLFVWIIGCDAVLICLSYFTNPTIFATNSNIITVSDDVITFMAKFSAIVLLLVLLGTFSCSLLVLIEIRKMQKMGAQGGRSETLQDLKRAAFICLFQSITYIIYTFFPIYIGFFPAIVGPRGSPITPDQAIWRTLFSVANSVMNPLYLLFTILDTALPIILLRSFKKTSNRIFLAMKRRLSGSTSVTPLDSVKQPNILDIHPAFQRRRSTRGDVLKHK